MGAYGGTWLDDGVLVTWPASMIRGLVLTQKLKLLAGTPHLFVEVAADRGRAWELSINVNNKEVLSARARVCRVHAGRKSPPQSRRNH